MAGQRTMWAWKDTIAQRVCRATSCGRTIWMAQNVKTGNFMPFVKPPEALASQRELETGREQVLLDLAHVHWADCSARSVFRRRSR